MKDFYIEIDGYCNTILAIYHIKADSYEEAVEKAKEIYVSELEFSNIETRDEAEERQCEAGLDDLDNWNNYEYGDDDQDDYLRRYVEEEYELKDGVLDKVSIREAEKIVGEEDGALDRFIGRDYETDEIIEWAHGDWDSGHPCDWEDFNGLCDDMEIAPIVRVKAYEIYQEHLHSEDECDDDWDDEEEDEDE